MAGRAATALHTKPMVPRATTALEGSPSRPYPQCGSVILPCGRNFQHRGRAGGPGLGAPRGGQGRLCAACSSIDVRLMSDCSPIQNRRTIEEQSENNRRTDGVGIALGWYVRCKPGVYGQLGVLLPATRWIPAPQRRQAQAASMRGHARGVPENNFARSLENVYLCSVESRVHGY